VADRAVQVIEELTDGSAETALIATHGGVIAALVPKLLDLPVPQWIQFGGVGNCHWCVLAVKDGRWRLHEYNVGPQIIIEELDQPEG
jgi:broad specificity phosphatase PhoE